MRCRGSSAGIGVRLTLVFVVLSVYWLSGCTLTEPSGEETTVTAESLRADVQARLTEARRDHLIALDLWERLIQGEPVPCAQVIPVPQPLVLLERDVAIHAQVGPIAAEFNAAVQSLRNAADLWTIECADDRVYVPLAMAREGRAAAVSAGRSLDAAQVLFDTWLQGGSS